MFFCHHRRQELHRSTSQCTECRIALAWPGVYALLSAHIAERLSMDCITHKDLQVWDNQNKCVAAAWQAYLTACSSVKRLPADVVSVKHQQAAQAARKAEHCGGQRYTALVAGVEPLVECQALFYGAIVLRMQYWRGLYQHFRFDMRSGIWLPGKRPPQNSHEAACFTQATHLYDFFTRIVLAGIDAVDLAQRDDPALFTRAADAMRAVLLGVPA